MKKPIIYLTVVFSFFLSLSCFSQSSDEALIRQLEEKERAAILKSDTAVLSEVMSKKIIVQNPENAIVGFRQIMGRIQGGKINYSAFERNIDTVALINNMAVVMGLETLVPRGNTQNAGKTVKRRFTNIWTKENGTWKLTARQATVVSVN